MRTYHIGIIAAAVCGAAALLIAQTGTDESPASPPAQGLEIKGETHTITLPQIAPPPLPDGPNKEKVEISCSTCHSLRYITMQPRFSKKVWTDEVNKMINTYKAEIAKPDVDPIVAYLVSAHGTADTTAAH